MVRKMAYMLASVLDESIFGDNTDRAGSSITTWQFKRSDWLQSHGNSTNADRGVALVLGRA